MITYLQLEKTRPKVIHENLSVRPVSLGSSSVTGECLTAATASG
jgi:hypothetical protein